MTQENKQSIISVEKLNNKLTKFSTVVLILWRTLYIMSCVFADVKSISVLFTETKKNKSGQLAQVARKIDFIATRGSKKTYIQSAYALETEEKIMTVNKPFGLTGDFFPKIIVRHDIRRRWYDDSGILNIGIIDFLLDDTIV